MDQEIILDYILERVKEDRVEEAKTLFAENFKKITEGSLAKEEMMMLIPVAMDLLKPDKVEEVLGMMNKFAGDFIKE